MFCYCLKLLKEKVAQLHIAINKRELLTKTQKLGDNEEPDLERCYTGTSCPSEKEHWKNPGGWLLMLLVSMVRPSSDGHGFDSFYRVSSH